jgi:hypothetical protein
MTHEERQARRHAIITRIEAAIAARLPHLLRPMDEDDALAAEAILKAVLDMQKTGYTTEKLAVLKDLAIDWHDARSNTP